MTTRACRSALAALAGILALASPGALPRAMAEPPASLRVLLDLAGPAPATSEVGYAELEALLASGRAMRGGDLASGQTLPEARPELVVEQVGAMSCGTALSRVAARVVESDTAAPGPRQQAATLLAPPRMSAPRVTAVPGEPLLLHHDVSIASRHAIGRRDLDGDGVPDAVAALLHDLAAASRAVLSRAGESRWPEPVAVHAAATPFAEGLYSAGDAASGIASHVVIPVGLRGSARLAACTHQLAHALVAQLLPDAPAAFDEALATWLGEEAFAELAGLETEPALLLPRPHARATLLAESPGAAREDATFLRFLTASLGVSEGWLDTLATSLPRHLEAARARRLAPDIASHAALGASLGDVLATRGWTLESAIAEFQIWSLEQDLLRDDEEVGVDVELDVMPDRVERDRLSPFSLLRSGVQVPPGGGLEILFDADPRLSATVVALSADGSILRVPLSSDMRGFAAGDVVRLVVLVQAAHEPAEWSGGSPSHAAFSLKVDDDPAYPFVLTAIGAETQPGQVTLGWDTASEEDLLGWWVERAIRPAGPFSRVSQAPVPAFGAPGQRGSYAFVDATVRPSTRYHYRVRGVTSSGLSEMSPTTSVRSLPATR